MLSNHVDVMTWSNDTSQRAAGFNLCLEHGDRAGALCKTSVAFVHAGGKRHHLLMTANHPMLCLELMPAHTMAERIPVCQAVGGCLCCMPCSSPFRQAASCSKKHNLCPACTAAKRTRTKRIDSGASNVAVRPCANRAH